MNKNHHSLAVTTDHAVHTLKKGNPKRIFLLLHGYLLDGEYILKILEESIPDNSLIIAPNGPFLVPVKKKEEFFPKYAWYFFDPNKQNYYIGFEPGAHYLKQIVAQYNPDKQPVTVIGYSQGGYLAPKIAELIPEVDQVIGLACAFRNKRFTYQKQVQYHQIHGERDLVVDMETSKKEFHLLQKSGNKGSFLELELEGHKLSSNFNKALKSML